MSVELTGLSGVPLAQRTYPALVDLSIERRLLACIVQKKLNTPPGDNEYLDGLTCPITWERLRPNSLVTKCAHTFSDAINLIIGNREGCPKCRGKVNSAVPNSALNALIAKLETEEPIPTAALFEKENKTRAASYLEIAKRHSAAGDYKRALEALSSALKASDAWEIYAEVPALYGKLGVKEKEALSLLHLSLYQLQAGKAVEAINSLKRCREIAPEVTLDVLIVELDLFLEPSEEKIGQALNMASTQEKREDAILIYKQLIACVPSCLPAYQHLISAYQKLIYPVPVQSDWDERRALCLQAAHYACTAGESALEAYFLEEAERSLPPPPIFTKADWEHPSLETLQKCYPYPPELKAFLTGPCSIWPGKTRSETHVVVPVFPSFVDDNGVTVELTLKTLEKLSTETGGPSYGDPVGTLPPQTTDGKFHWGVITKGIVHQSRHLTYNAMERLVSAFPEGYEVPSALNAATAMLWERRLLGDKSGFISERYNEFYTVSKDSYQGEPLMVGRFYKNGFLNIHRANVMPHDSIAVAPWKRF